MPCCGHDLCEKRIRRHLLSSLFSPGCQTGLREAQVKKVTSLTNGKMALARPLRSFGEEAHLNSTVWFHRGRQSPICKKFFVQKATESMWEGAKCGLVRRSFSNIAYVKLNFTSAIGGAYILAKLLADSHRDELRSGHAQYCVSGLDDHKGGAVKLSRITHASQYLYIRFPRFAGTARQVVELPEFLDISSVSDDPELHSGWVPLVLDRVYRLTPINMYYRVEEETAGENWRGHYSLYTVQNGIWMCFDDMLKAFAVAEKPQQAYKKGGIANFVVYQQLRDRETLPYDPEGTGLTQGHILRQGITAPSPQEVEPRWHPVSVYCDKCTKSFDDRAAFDAHRPGCDNSENDR